MAKLGTAYVEVQPDLSAFDRLIARKFASSFKGTGERAGIDFSKGFNTKVRTTVKAPEVPTPKIDAPTIPAPKVTPPDLSKLDLSEDARINLKIEGADADIARIKTKIAELQAQPATVEVKAQIAKAILDLERVEAKKARLSASAADINVDVDRSGIGIFNQLADGAQRLIGTLGGSGGGGLTAATTRVSAGFVSFGSTAGPLAAVLGALSITIGVSLVAALAALAGSLAFAVAGVAALAAAVAGVLGPAVALVVATVGRLTKVFEALKAEDAAADEVGRRTAAGSQAAAAAAQAQEAAARGLTEANRQLGAASKAAYREMEDAAEAASDAIRGVVSAQLSLDSAKLSTREARHELAEFRAEVGATGDAFADVFEKFTDVSVDTSGLRKALVDANRAAGGPKLDEGQELRLERLILNVRAAREREKEATDGVSDAIRASTRAQQLDNKFKRDGIKASESYQAALRGVESATLAVAQAQDQQELSAAQVKAIDLTSKLTEKEQQLLEAIKKVRTELKGAFKGATDAVFGGMLKALGRLPQLINPLRGAFTRLGEAWGDAIDTFSKGLVSADSIAKLRAFTNGAARLAGPITKGLSALLDILTDIGRAALPFLISGTEKVANQLQEWTKTTGDQRKMSRVIGGIVGHLKTWLGVGAAVADVFLAFFTSAAGPGKSLAESIKSLAERTAAWLRSDEGRKEMRQFFEDLIPLAKDFVKLMLDVAKAFVTIARIVAPVIGFLKNMRFEALFLRDVFLRVFGAASDAVSSFADDLAGKVSGALRGLPNGARAAGLRIVAGLASGLVSAPAAVSAALREALLLALRTVTGFAAPMAERGGRLVRAIAAGVTGAASAVASAVTNAINAAIRAITGMLDRVRGAGRSIGRGLVDGIRSGLGALAGIGKTIVNALVDVLNKAMTAINNALPDKIAIPKLPDINLPDNPLPTIPKFKRGGIVPGVGNSDTRLIYTTPGEHVTRKKIVAKFGPTVFADINEGRLDPTVGYAEGERPSVSTVPVRGNRFATGGLVGAATTTEQRPNLTIHAPVTVPGGGPPDPVALGVALIREAERRGGYPGGD